MSGRQLWLNWASTFDEKYTDVAVKAVENDRAVKVISAGLQALLSLDKEKALESAKKLEGEDSESIILTLADLYAQTEDPTHLPYFEEKFDKGERVCSIWVHRKLCNHFL